MAKSMDFPNSAKKRKYSDNLEDSANEQEQGLIQFVAVPGPQGERGPKGDKGDKGDRGETGPKGEQGPTGKNGIDGKDGRSLLSPSEQNIGWACYDNKNKKIIRTGASVGDDGWVRIGVDGLGSKTDERFLPNGSKSLWLAEAQKINFRTLNIGAILKIRYDVQLTTYSNNTEVWFRTYIANNEQYPTTYVGALKYQFDYDLSLEHTLFLTDGSMQASAAIPQIRTDNSSDLIVKSIYISIS